MRAIIRYAVSVELLPPDDYPPEIASWKEAAEFEERLIMVTVEHGTDKEIELGVELESIDLADPESEPFVRSQNPHSGF